MHYVEVIKVANVLMMFESFVWCNVLLTVQSPWLVSLVYIPVNADVVCPQSNLSPRSVCTRTRPRVLTKGRKAPLYSKKPLSDLLVKLTCLGS
jgi:hypothetical protein